MVCILIVCLNFKIHLENGLDLYLVLDFNKLLNNSLTIPLR